MASHAPSADRPADRHDGALDGLRGVAALSVLCFHVWLYRVDRPHHARTHVIDQVMFEANVGLVCFFVLSGYLLYRSFARAALTGTRPVNARGYGVRRVARIAPAYYACMAGCLILYWAVGYSAITPSAGQLPLFAVFAQNYSIDTVMHIDPVTWTLCIEAAFYVALPVLGLVAFRLGPRRVGRQAALLLSLIGVTIVWNWIVVLRRWDAVASKSLLAFMAHFALGMLVAQWAVWRELRHGAAARLRASTTAALALSGATLVFANGYWHETAWLQGTALRPVAANLVAAVGFAAIIAAIAVGRGPAVSWLSLRPLAGLGVISYGVYLWHLPLILVVRQIGLLPTPLLPRTLTVTALAVGAGLASWRLLEHPAIAWAAARRTPYASMGSHTSRIAVLGVAPGRDRARDGRADRAALAPAQPVDLDRRRLSSAIE